MNTYKKFIPLVAALAVLILVGCSCSAGNRADAEEGTTTSTTIAPAATPAPKPKPKVTEGSFDELRKTCTTDDRKVFDAVIRQFNKRPKATDTPATAPYKDELVFILAGAKNGLYVAAIALAPEDSCLKAFVPHLPPVQPTSSGSRRGGAGNGSGGNGNTTQSTVGGANCSGGNIDPDGTGPRGCEPTVPSDVGAGGGTPTQPSPPPAVATTTTTAPAPSTTAPTQPVVVIDANGQPTGTAPPVTAPPATPPPNTCWVIDGVETCN